ncbi:MAG: phosphatase PAP2 family protein [Solirubrobacteraceae bacterium]
MVARLRHVSTRLLPHGPLDVVWQLALFAGAYYGYRFVRGAIDGQAAAAFQNARDIISIERSLHLFVEPSVQAWATSRDAVISFASWMYMNSHFTMTIATLVFIYLFRNSSFYFVRNMFMVAMGLALVGYLVFPTAPPRMLPEWGFTDSVSSFTGIPQDSVTVNALFNPFAAVPSMHVGFSLMLGGSMARLVKPVPLKVAWALYPLVVSFVVIATGNHYWLDALLGALTAVTAYGAATMMARLRPARWSFRPTAAGAPARAPLGEAATA